MSARRSLSTFVLMASYTTWYDIIDRLVGMDRISLIIPGIIVKIYILLLSSGYTCTKQICKIHFTFPFIQGENMAWHLVAF